MANIRSAEKNIRKTTARTAHNQTVKSRIRTLRKKVIAAVTKKDAAAAAASLSELPAADEGIQDQRSQEEYLPSEEPFGLGVGALFKSTFRSVATALALPWLSLL